MNFPPGIAWRDATVRLDVLEEEGRRVRDNPKLKMSVRLHYRQPEPSKILLPSDYTLIAPAASMLLGADGAPLGRTDEKAPGQR